MSPAPDRSSTLDIGKSLSLEFKLTNVSLLLTQYMEFTEVCAESWKQCGILQKYGNCYFLFLAEKHNLKTYFLFSFELLYLEKSIVRLPEAGGPEATFWSPCFPPKGEG